MIELSVNELITYWSLSVSLLTISCFPFIKCCVRLIQHRKPFPPLLLASTCTMVSNGLLIIIFIIYDIHHIIQQGAKNDTTCDIFSFVAISALVADTGGPLLIAIVTTVTVQMHERPSQSFVIGGITIFWVLGLIGSGIMYSQNYLGLHPSKLFCCWMY